MRITIPDKILTMRLIKLGSFKQVGKGLSVILFPPIPINKLLAYVRWIVVACSHRFSSSSQLILHDCRRIATRALITMVAEARVCRPDLSPVWVLRVAWAAVAADPASWAVAYSFYS